MIRAVVFDVGETLVDETRIWSRWADRLGVPRFAFMGVIGGMAATGRPVTDVFGMVRPGVDWAVEEAAWAAEEPESLRNNFDGDDLYPDVRGALAELRRRGLTVVIAGNQPPQAKAALERMELPVDAVYTSAEWGLEKPDPAFFAKVAEVVGVSAGEICYVGDRVDNDVLPVQEAGMMPVLIRRGPWGYLSAEMPEAAWYATVVNSLHELPELLAPA
ncbi:HAD family hydrolase [Nocardia huaxiensis]|uniref:HAD family hydrolase n=1 Tax=Nocardia huaxiensis TaxID=2755382 RepID=A0A7D6VFG9_9NOCA|nr:HAD family hydrolase [Nocardia huaxiensis]QLY33222.1 HAD family hydrolase [Nocardia huaxiensis]UFS99846.1 HAD family hydrolase [Nocardia huaxiensis]